MKWVSVWHHFVLALFRPAETRRFLSCFQNYIYYLEFLYYIYLSIYLSIFLFHWTILKIYLLAVFFFFHVLLRCDFRLIWHLSASLRFSISALLLNHLLVSTTGCMLFVLHSSARRLPILLNPLFRWLKKMKLFLCDFLLIIFSPITVFLRASSITLPETIVRDSTHFISPASCELHNLFIALPQLFCPAPPTYLPL